MFKYIYIKLFLVILNGCKCMLNGSNNDIIGVLVVLNCLNNIK